MAAILVTACGPSLPSVPPPPDPFTRYPYVQAVAESSAVVVWRTEAESRDSVVYSARPSDTVRVADPDALRNHVSHIDGLDPSSRVTYRVIPGGGRAPSGWSTFETAPPRGSRDTFRVLVWGDSGWGSDAQVELARQMELRSFALALHTGDIAYDDGTEFDFTHRHFRVYRKLLARTPMFPSVGNHDVRADQGESYDEAFVLPGAAEAEGRRYYSFDWGSVHFVALDSNESAPHPDLRAGGAQRAWLADDLAASAADPAIHWIVVYLHHPIYSAARGFSSHGSDRDLRESLSPLFDRYGVDLILSGHDHIYERSHPLRENEIRAPGEGTVYVVTGGGGGPRRFRSAGRAWHTAESSSAHHFLEIDVTLEGLKGRAIGREGEVLDSFTVPAVAAQRPVRSR